MPEGHTVHRIARQFARDLVGRRVAVSSPQGRFAQGAAEERARIAAALRRAGAGHLQLRTDRDWLMDVVRFVGERRRAGSGGASR